MEGGEAGALAGHIHDSAAPKPASRRAALNSAEVICGLKRRMVSSPLCRHHLGPDALHGAGTDAEAGGDLVHAGVALRQRGPDSTDAGRKR
jgi:hypothetical protein